MKRDIDFQTVEQKHWDIHLRLENWGRWARSPSMSNVAPMFRLYRSDEHWEQREPNIPVDGADATKIQKAVVALPEKHRWSMVWYYVSPSSPGRAARRLATNLEGLALYCRESRTMLCNRRA